MKLRLLLVLVFALAACSTGQEPQRSESEGGTGEEPRAVADVTEVELWFQRDGSLHRVTRTVQSTPRIGTAALNLLIQGPTRPEQSDGIASSLDPTARLESLAVEDGVATADFAAGFGSAQPQVVRDRIAQVVYTLTQFPTVARVVVQSNGSPVGGESGSAFDRSDFETMLAPIVVSQPLSGAESSSPLTVAGSANVFEATVSIRIVAENGDVLAETFTTATCGTGCRGDYSKKVKFDIDEPTDAIVQVYEASAEDGRPLHMVEVPVTLLP
jgi:Immunoglobulin-like domain of bacterial spore germination/Sporulation and spore germination